MLDLKFDIATREIVWENNDFVNETNPSAQNGGIIQYSRTAILRNPILGVGMEEAINSGLSKTTYEMNRWKNQALNDGATTANWQATPDGNDVLIEAKVDYEQ